MYVREKAEDGKTFADFYLPEFKAYDLQERVVRSSDLVGKPTLLVLLALHCNHSIESLPILQELAGRYGPEGLNVVGVVVNSSSAEDVGYWIFHHTANARRDYSVWVYDDTSLGDLIQSHLVPTYFFIDQDGRILTKLVGFKAQDEVASRLAMIRTQAARELRKAAAEG